MIQVFSAPLRAGVFENEADGMGAMAWNRTYVVMECLADGGGDSCAIRYLECCNQEQVGRSLGARHE